MESGLINLRAELHKKRAEVAKDLASRHNHVERHQCKAFPSKSRKERLSSIGRKNEVDEDKESRKEFEKSRSILELKAALYDKLKEGTAALQDDELNDKFLVNFQKKIEEKVVENKAKSMEQIQAISQNAMEALNPEDYKALKSGEEWTEYVDSFGRTRVCLQKDFEEMKKKEQIIKDAEVEEEIKEKFRKKWSDSEMNAFQKDQIHYQDVLYDEARAHGIGFMPFSRDENERKKQQDELRHLRKETMQAELLKRANDKSKKARMAERLAKVKQRKRLKLGLPCKDLEEQKLKTPPPSDDESEPYNNIEHEVDEKLKKLEEERENERKAKEAKLREWDIGKINSGGSLLTQEQWVERKRNERHDEFAPVKNTTSDLLKTRHMNDFGGDDKFEDSKVENSDIGSNKIDLNHPSKCGHSSKWQESKNFNFAPPSTYEYYGPSHVKFIPEKTGKRQKDLEQAISAGLANLRKSS